MIIVAIAFLGGLLFALVPVVAYGLLLLAGLAALTFPSLILSVAAKLVWMALFFAFLFPPVIGLITTQFLVGFAEVVDLLWARDDSDKQDTSKQDAEDYARDQAAAEKLVRDLPEIPAQDKGSK